MILVAGVDEGVAKDATSMARFGWGRHHAAHRFLEQARMEHMRKEGHYCSTRLVALEGTLSGRHGRKKIAHPQKDEGEEESSPQYTHPSALFH